MLRRTCNLLISAALATVSVSCNQSATPQADLRSPATTAVVASASKVLLTEQPADGKPVGELRASTTDGAEITILGRIGGDTNPWVEGRAAFTIVDPKLEPCKPEEGCLTPWDYCCSTDQIPANRALIKVVDDAGRTVEQDARQVLGVKELQMVLVKGTAKRDEAGNLTVLASGVYLVPEQK